MAVRNKQYIYIYI